MTIICWKWHQSNYRVNFDAKAVNTWASMVNRNTSEDHRLLCITDDPKGIEIETYPLWQTDIKTTGWTSGRPQCYRRLKAYSKEFKEVAGERFAMIDLDVVITSNIDHILNRKEDFIINSGYTDKNCYNGAFQMMDSGCRSHVYDYLTQYKAELASNQYLGSDQAWIRWILGKNESTIGKKDGVYWYSNYENKKLPDNACMMFFHGRIKPWTKGMNKGWIKEHYH